jgi:hypothetical protein
LRQNTTQKAKQGILNRGRGHETELKIAVRNSAPDAGRIRNEKATQALGSKMMERKEADYAREEANAMHVEKCSRRMSSRILEFSEGAVTPASWSRGAA